MMSTTGRVRILKIMCGFLCVAAAIVDCGSPAYGEILDINLTIRIERAQPIPYEPVRVELIVANQQPNSDVSVVTPQWRGCWQVEYREVGEEPWHVLTEWWIAMELVSPPVPMVLAAGDAITVHREFLGINEQGQPYFRIGQAYEMRVTYWPHVNRHAGNITRTVKFNTAPAMPKADEQVIAHLLNLADKEHTQLLLNALLPDGSILINKDVVAKHVADVVKHYPESVISRFLLRSVVISLARQRNPQQLDAIDSALVKRARDMEHWPWQADLTLAQSLTRLGPLPKELGDQKQRVVRQTLTALEHAMSQRDIDGIHSLMQPGEGRDRKIASLRNELANEVSDGNLRYRIEVEKISEVAGMVLVAAKLHGTLDGNVLVESQRQRFWLVEHDGKYLVVDF